MRRTSHVVSAVVAVLVLAGDEARAQFPITFAAGPTVASISSSQYDTGSKIGYFLAAGTRFQVNESVSVDPFLSYVRKGGEFDGEDGSYDYIEVPLLITYALPLGESDRLLRFGAGPQVALQVNCDESGFDCTQFNDHEGTEFGLVLNAGIGFPLTGGGDLSVGAGVDLGLTNLFDEDFKTRTFFLYAAYGLTVGG